MKRMEENDFLRFSYNLVSFYSLIYPSRVCECSEWCKSYMGLSDVNETCVVMSLCSEFIEVEGND